MQKCYNKKGCFLRHEGYSSASYVFCKVPGCFPVMGGLFRINDFMDIFDSCFPVIGVILVSLNAVKNY